MYTYIPISPPSCVSLPPSLSHPSRWSQSTRLISLCYAAASHQLSILHLVVYICQCYSLTSSQLTLPPPSRMSSSPFSTSAEEDIHYLYLLSTECAICFDQWTLCRIHLGMFILVKKSVLNTSSSPNFPSPVVTLLTVLLTILDVLILFQWYFLWYPRCLNTRTQPSQ